MIGVSRYPQGGIEKILQQRSSKFPCFGYGLPRSINCRIHSIQDTGDGRLFIRVYRDGAMYFTDVAFADFIEWRYRQMLWIDGD